MLTAAQRPRIAQLAFLVVAAFPSDEQVRSPQFSLWLVPLAVLALPHRRILLAWMTIDALMWIPRMMFLYGDPNHGLPEQPFTTLVLLRDVAVMAMCAMVIRQIYRPEHDLVRFGGHVDDPSGGSVRARARRSARLAARWLRPRPIRYAGARSIERAGGRTGLRAQPEEMADEGGDRALRRNTSLDAIGPYEALQRVPSIDVVFVGHRRGEVRSDNGMLGSMVDTTFDEVTSPMW